LPNELDDPLALIDLLPQHQAQIASFGPKNILPDWLVAKEGERIGHKLSRAAQLLAYRRNKNGRTRRHGENE
jgi:hypothetical protein